MGGHQYTRDEYQGDVPIFDLQRDISPPTEKYQQDKSNNSPNPCNDGNGQVHKPAQRSGGGNEEHRQIDFQ